MLIYMCIAAQFAELLSFGVHLSMCFTVRKGRAYITWALETFFPVLRGYSWPCATTTPWTHGIFWRETLSKNHRSHGNTLLAQGGGGGQCSCHPHRVCYTHEEGQPVVHVDRDLPRENVLVSQAGRLLPTDRLVRLIAATFWRR